MCEPESQTVVVRHGARVETYPDWFGEAAWDGDFAAGGLDRTDIVVGSGARLRDDEVVFVSAGNTVDRLQTLAISSGVRVSNSLACLLASGDVQLDPTYRRYYADFRTVILGLSKLNSRVHTLKGDLRLHYYFNLAWDGHALHRRGKPLMKRNFSSFAAYERFLLDTMTAISTNAADSRRIVCFHGLGTVSRGYDSSMVAAIASKAGGVDQAMTFTKAQSGLSDDGTEIANQLGLQTTPIARNAYREFHWPEVPFLASNGYGEEVHYRGAEQLLENRILYTGHHGDNVWGKNTKYRGPDIVRKDPAGLAFTEYRLRAGFLHCPVPFWGIHQIADIVAVSNASEMKPWDVPGDYSRPICRRVVEECGVARDLFGQRKAATVVMMFDANEKFLTPDSLDDFNEWLERKGGAPWAALRREEKFFKFMAGNARKLKAPWLVQKYLIRQAVPMFYLLFPWAAERAAQAYRQ